MWALTWQGRRTAGGRMANRQAAQDIKIQACSVAVATALERAESKRYVLHRTAWPAFVIIPAYTRLAAGCPARSDQLSRRPRSIVHALLPADRLVRHVAGRAAGRRRTGHRLRAQQPDDQATPRP